MTGTLHEDLCIFIITSRWVLLKTKNISDKSCRENQNTHLMISNFFLSRSLWGNVEKYGTSETDHIWQRNTAHALCMLDTWSYRHTFRKCNIYCFSTATMVTRTRLNVKFIPKLPVMLEYDFVGISPLSFPAEKIWIAPKPWWSPSP
jgi:hypothetical protein